ncbi:hypothetical protein QUB19_17880 [Microcoleus sp. B4-C5]|uniref:hypothetical protein n=1 Tax=unclassified Microcoleus TaxID=2642155 RepID=UPI002FCECBF3
MGLMAGKITEVGIPGADVIVSASALIIGQINRNEDRLEEASRRGSLVASYCEQMYHQFSQANPLIRACIVTVSTLPKETSNLSWVGNEQISEWGYSVEVGFQGGWIRNNGNRGFENWCVCGANHQDNNVIYID